MSTVLFLLGAGASKESGTPVMREFLDVAEDLLRMGRVSTKEADFELVFKAISRLAQVHSKATLDIHNIESIFAAFEMARTIGVFGEYSSADIDRLLLAMAEVITATLEQTQVFPGAHEGLAPPVPYSSLVKLVRFLTKEAAPVQSVAVVTFNYDIGADFAFNWNGQSIDYGLTGDRVERAIPLLKLHGSLNWRKCGKCESVIDFPVTAAQMEEFSVPVPNKSARLFIASKAPLYHCDSDLAPPPVIVPPTGNKTQYHRQLANVWGRAAQEFSQAEQIFVFGYSLPESDAFFRYLYALGSAGAARLRRFWVFDPDVSGRVEARFRALLGPGAEERFEYHAMSFKMGLKYLYGVFNFH